MLGVWTVSLVSFGVSAQSSPPVCSTTTTITANSGPIILGTDRECLQINSGVTVSGPLEAVNNSGVQDVQINNQGIINGSTGIFANVGASIYSLTNSNVINSTSSGIYNSGTISNLTNNSGATLSGGFTGIYLDGGTIGTLTNNNGATITGNVGIFVYDTPSQISTLTNFGVISSSTGNFSGIQNEATISFLENRSGGSIIGHGGIYNFGTASIITALTNAGNITGNSSQGIQNEGTITNLTNQNGGTISGFGSGIYNLGVTSLISSITNSGSISGNLYGIDNDGTIVTVTNNPSGLIGAGIAGILNRSNGQMREIENRGLISAIDNLGAMDRILNRNSGGIASLINSGELASFSTHAIYNEGSIRNITNNSSGVIFSHASYGISNDGSGAIESITNTGSISGATGGIYNFGSIGTLNNSGTIFAGGAGGVGIYNFGSIGTLNNSGTISASGAGGVGIYNVRTITTLTNYGSIGGGGEGILNAGIGLITLNNAQGGNGSSPATTALTYSGSKPTNYNIIINSSTHYGQIVFLTAGGSIERFGIYGSPFITSRTYASVLAGTGGVHVGNSSGTTYDNMTWSLVENDADVYDLIFTGASLMGTQQSLVNTASVLQGTFTLQNTVMVNGFTYDCSLFDQRGICVSAGGRNTTVQAQGINNTSGLLIASYRLNKNNSRIGAWVDQNLSVSGPGTVKLGNSTPMIGLFGVWSQRPDGVGAEVKVSAAYGQKDTTITRQIVGLSEAGSGSSQLISQGAQVVAKYGFAVMPDVVVSPYTGVRYTQNNMGGYTEAATSAVTAPLTYSALNTNATTALAGAEARYRGIPKTTLFASGGVETDTNTSNGSYSATGIAGLTPVNFNPNPVKTRPTATVGGYYDILKNQRIGVTGIYRQEPFQAVSTTTVLATYTIGL